MIISSISLTNFRSHKKYRLDCRKNTSLIIGPNGSGKTSVLEAIYLAMRGKSFRATDPDILRRGAEYYRVEMEYADGERVAVTYDGNKRAFFCGDKKSARLPKKNRYPVVLFLPSDLHLVEASPTSRRDYFDRVLSQLDDSYSNALGKYNKALKQRNELLKALSDEYGQFSAGVSDSLFSWNILLAKYGTEVRRKRQDLVRELNARFTEVYRSIAENEDEVLLAYEVQGYVLSESEYLAKLTANFNRDAVIGHTTYGVHRDNFEFIFNSAQADGSASRGEVRSMILAMKFIEAQLIYQKTQRKPVVLLDDVFSELDSKRQKCLVQNFKDSQVIITSVEVEKI